MLLHFVFRSKRHCGGIAEPIDEAHSKVAFLVSLAIEPAPRLCLLLSGGIMAKINQPKAVGHSFRIIEMKKRGSSAPTCGNALDKTTVEAKMAIPSLLTWIEEEDDFLCCWVDRCKV